MNLNGKKILIVGAGISGFAAARLCRKFGATVVLSDAKAEADIKADLQPMRDIGVELVCGPQQESLLDGVDDVIVSPAVPERIPLVQAAYQRGIRVLTEVELAQLLAQSPILAVTGTNGKTATVTLLSLLMQTRYPEEKVGLAGNIGVPLSETALKIGADGCIVAEISSFQMEATHHFHPHVAAVLNVTPDHIIRHKTMDVYQAMKEKLFAEQTAEDFLVLNYDDARTRGMKERALSRVCYFSATQELAEGAFVHEGRLTIRWEGQSYPLCTVEELGIKGQHNVANALAASACAFLAGCAPRAMVKVLETFKGVEHRLEFVRELDGVPYYNDSKATNTDSAEKALLTFPNHIILLAGGDDKMTDLTSFLTLVKERVDALILIGDAAKRFHEDAVKDGYPEAQIYEAGYSMEKAVKLARDMAKAPQVVLLSPACASFDMYDNMAERGRDFKRLVNALH